jgi:hypothetical protein
MPRSHLRALISVTIAAGLLLVPAALWGRPFIFYDTAVYWGWGRDVVEALRHPWPRADEAWITGRPLHAWELGAHGAQPNDLRYTLTAIKSRSAFYAIPLYLLTEVGGLWLVAGLQALVAAWTLRASIRALAPELGERAFLVIAAALVGLTSLGFEVGYAMPDLFGGLACLAAGVLVASGERLSRFSRVGLVAVIAYAVLAHPENGLNVAAAIGFGFVLFARDGRRRAFARVAPLGVALVASLVVATIGDGALQWGFGRPLHQAPFLASRVLADGAGQRYLSTVCPKAPLASCGLVGTDADYPEYYLALYPLEPPPDLREAAQLYHRLQFVHVSDAVAARRERFVAEQPTLVLGAIAADAPGLATAALRRIAAEAVAGGVAPDFDSLAGVLRQQTEGETQGSREAIAITPGAASCRGQRGRGCGELELGGLETVQQLVLLAAAAAAALMLIRGAAGAEATLRAFAAQMLFLVLANALLCAALAGVYDRYQIRVAWLLPFAALVAIASWAARRRRAEATLPSPVAPIVAEPSIGAAP